MLIADTLTDILQYAVRGGAALLGGVLGWFLSKPLFNSLSRLAFQRPIAKEILPLFRAAAAFGLALLFFFLIPAGGLGPGLGPGEGPGEGPGAKRKNGVKDRVTEAPDKDGIRDGKKEEPAPDLIRVEILGGKRYPGNEKWYLYEREDPPLDRNELRDRIRAYMKEAGLKTARMQPVVTTDTRFDWEAARGPELREIRKELGLKPVDPVVPKAGK